MASAAPNTNNFHVPQPMNRPYHCFRCNRYLGQRTSAGLRTETVVLHPKQSFSCTKCKWRFESVSIAFAETDKAQAPAEAPKPPEGENKSGDNKGKKK